MSQKSSLPRKAVSVSQVLMPDSDEDKPKETAPSQVAVMSIPFDHEASQLQTE
jgi:hypothetical protein